MVIKIHIFNICCTYIWLSRLTIYMIKYVLLKFILLKHIK